jgi:hypothetical protein
MAWFQRRDWRDDVSDNVAHHLSSLRREVMALSGEAGRYGHQLADRYGPRVAHSAGEIGEALAHQGAVVAQQLGKQARRAGRAVKDDPVPTVVAVVGLLCLASLVMARTRR